jgi:hypothetical protein
VHARGAVLEGLCIVKVVGKFAFILLFHMLEVRKS